jgi:hypothetical protein
MKLFFFYIMASLLIVEVSSLGVNIPVPINYTTVIQNLTTNNSNYLQGYTPYNLPYLNLSGTNANQNINIDSWNFTATWFFGNLNSSFIQNIPTLWTTTYNSTYHNYIIQNKSNSTTWWATVSNFVTGYLYKNGNNLDLNETRLNNTIASKSYNSINNTNITFQITKYPMGGCIRDNQTWGIIIESVCAV